MQVSKQAMPAHIKAALPALVADIVDYLGVEESDEISVADLTLDGNYAAEHSVAFLVYEFKADDESAIAAIKLNPKTSSFQDAAVFSWGRDDGQSTEETLADFLEMNPHF